MHLFSFFDFHLNFIAWSQRWSEEGSDTILAGGSHELERDLRGLAPPILPLPRANMASRAIG